MEDWKEYKLVEVCENIYSGGTPSSMNASYWNGSLPWLSSGETAQRYILSTEKYITKEGAENSSTRYAYKGSTVVASAGQGHTRGQASLLCIDTYVNQSVLVLRPNTKIIDSHYLYYNIDSRYNELRQLSDGTSTRGSLSGKILKDLNIYLPPLNEQKRIASILKSLDDKIECNKRINENLEQQAQALFDKLLMNEELSRDKVLKDYAFINPTRSIKKGEVARYIDMSSLPTKGSFPSDWVDKPFNGGMKFQNGDTLMARITPCLENGKTAYINFLKKDEIAFGSTEYIVMAPHEGIPSEMFYFLARNDDFVSYAVAHMNGSSGRQRVSASDIENYIMPNIPSHIIEQFGLKANAIMETIKNNSLESRRLAELRDTLLPRLMSGEISVNEIEK